jgi:hypothetical protein
MALSTPTEFFRAQTLVPKYTLLYTGTTRLLITSSSAWPMALYTHTHTHIHSHTHTHTHERTHARRLARTHARTHVCVCVCVCFCNHVMMCCVAEATARYKETTLPRFFALWQGTLTTMRLQETCLYYYNLRCRQKPFFEVHVCVQAGTTPFTLFGIAKERSVPAVDEILRRNIF